MLKLLLALLSTSAFQENPQEFWKYDSFDGFEHPTVVTHKSTLETNGYCLITIQDHYGRMYTTNNTYKFGDYLCNKYNVGDTIIEEYNKEIVNLNKYLRKKKKSLRKSR